jgi:hypothetical protein
MKYQGIDRVNNDTGYFSDNVFSCCADCREMKMDRTIDEWYGHMERVLLYRKLKASLLLVA